MKHFYILSLLLSISHITLPMQASFYEPSACLEKPRFARMNLTSVDITLENSSSKCSYNRKGQKAPLLAYRGVEPLLPQFLDPSVPLDTAIPLCYGLFDARYSEIYYGASVSQNIHESMFFELSSCICFDKLQNITMIPTTATGKPLTTQEIDSNSKLKAYLPLLQQTIGSTQKCSIIGPTYFLLGYTKSLTTFDYLDFVDITLQTGCIVPIILLDRPGSKLVVFPRQNMVNLGIPLQLTIALGVYDWLNIGASGSVINYIKNDQVIPLNTAAASNKLLIPQSGLCTVHHEPQFALSAYIEGEYFLPNWTWFVGVSYTKQNPTHYQAYDRQKFPTSVINKYPSQNRWELAYVTIASEFDFIVHPKHVMPRLKLVYTKPFYGRTCFASSTLAGQLGLEISYDF